MAVQLVAAARSPFFFVMLAVVFAVSSLQLRRLVTIARRSEKISRDEIDAAVAGFAAERRRR